MFKLLRIRICVCVCARLTSLCVGVCGGVCVFASLLNRHRGTVCSDVLQRLLQHCIRAQSDDLLQFHWSPVLLCLCSGMIIYSPLEENSLGDDCVSVDSGGTP